VIMDSTTANVSLNEKVFYVPLKTLLGYIITATSEGMKQG